jgi:pimeloyl-ACP methyl ester carboxylesterase
MPRPVRPLVLFVVIFSALGFGSCPGNPLLQTREQIPGFVEPHTPGSADADEFVPPDGGTIERILGSDVDLNHVDYIRTAFTDSHPKVILIAIPGFLGGGSTFDPLARDLVGAFKGSVEVWAVDRRTNQLEDRRGALHARAAAEAAGDDAAVFQALSEGVRFYFPGSDTDGNSIPDPAFELPDAFGTPSSFLRLSQDEVRPFGAHWGVDTYARDWRELVLHARSIVGETGLVLFGGHSMGTTWAGVFAAYDFDPGPGVEAGYELVDGLVLFEGGGPRQPSADAPDLAAYQAGIAGLEAPGGDPIFLEDLFGFIDAVDLGGAGELNGLAGSFAPDEPSIVQTTPIFGGFPISFLLPLATNESLVGFFLDDDFSTNAAFSASMGFSADHQNFVNPFADFGFEGDFYVGLTQPGVPRTWINYDSPRFDSADPDPLTCPPILPPPFPDAELGDVGTGCAIIDNGPEPGPGDPIAGWGVEREVTDIRVLLRTLYETGNASEWYFNSGRPDLDLAFGRDSSALGAPALLNVSQNANVDVPVLAIGGSNGLTPTESSYDDYLGSIASADTEVVILEGYSHLDVLSAAENEALPPLAAWILKLRIQKIFESSFP